MKFTIDIDGTAREVEAGPDGALVIDGKAFQVKVGRASGDRRTVQVGDKTYEVRVMEGGAGLSGPAPGPAPAPAAAGGAAGSAAPAGPMAYLLEVGGERVPVTVTRVERRLWGGAEAGVPTGTAPAAGGAATGGAATGGAAAAGAAPPADTVKDGIWAPVPGKIVDVLVKAGDRVAQGDLVLILEAMKMENELHATKDATVSAVLVAKGDQAERGQLLVAFD